MSNFLTSNSVIDEVRTLSLAPPEAGSVEIIEENRQLAGVLPEATPLAFFLSTREADWEALKDFALFDRVSLFLGGSLTPGTLPFLPPRWQDAYDGRIQDWAGGQAAIALLPDTTPNSITATDVPSKMYMVLPVTDRSALAPFLAALATARGDIAPEKSTYGEAELWVWPTRRESWDELLSPELPVPEVPLEVPDASPEPMPDKAGPKAIEVNPMPEMPNIPEDFERADDTFEVPGLTVAMVGDYLVFAKESAAVKTLVDYQQWGDPSLGESELFLRSQYTDTEGAIARLYSNLSEVVKFDLDGSLPGVTRFPSPVPLPPGLPDFSSFPGLSLPPNARQMAAETLAGVTLDTLVFPQDEGMRLQGRLYGNGILQSSATPELPYADSALAFVPAPTYALSSGRNVAGFWQQVASGLASNEAAKPFLEQARSKVLMATGLDLDTELLGWMDREFVLFFFPSHEGAINSVASGAGVEVGIAIQTSDRTTAQKALDALDELVGPYVAVDTTVNDAPAVSWQGPNFAGEQGSFEPVSYLSHSWIADDTVLVASGTGAMKRLLNATAFDPINEHPTFLNATQPLANPNNGYSYLNAGSTLSLVYSLLGQWFGPISEGFFFQQVQSVLGTIRGFGTTTSSTDEYWQLDSIMTLAPAESENTNGAPDMFLIPPDQ